jgi:hypothetical protein
VHLSVEIFSPAKTFFNFISHPHQYARCARHILFYYICRRQQCAAAACSAYIAAGHVRDVTWASIFSALPEDVRNFKCVQGGVDAAVAAW